MQATVLHTLAVSSVLVLGVSGTPALAAGQSARAAASWPSKHQHRPPAAGSASHQPSAVVVRLTPTAPARLAAAASTH
jgi:hypothetical protein